MPNPDRQPIPGVHFRLTREDVESLSDLAEFLNVRSPKHHNAPNITGIIRLLAARRCFLIGPGTKAEFMWLKSALEVIAAHSSLFLNGLQDEDRQAALSFLGRVRGEMAWQLGEGR